MLHKVQGVVFWMHTFACCWVKLVIRRIARNSQWEGCFWGVGAEPPELENLPFIAKITIWAILMKKIMLLKRGIEICSTNTIKVVA